MNDRLIVHFLVLIFLLLTNNSYGQYESDPMYYTFRSYDEESNDYCLLKWHGAGSVSCKTEHYPSLVLHAVKDLGLKTNGTDNSILLNGFISQAIIKYPYQEILIYFPEGTYNFNSTIQLVGNGSTYEKVLRRITLKGESAATTIFYINHQATGIFLNNATSIGLEDFSIVRNRAKGGGKDPSVAGGYNVLMQNANNCWMSGIFSKDAFSAHVSLLGGTNGDNVCYNTITGCTFFEALGYGDNEEGYGVNFNGASYNLLQNCLFDTLRHAISFQQQSKFNVVAYNASYRAHQTPNYSGGLFSPADLSFHGRFSDYPGPRSNLLEGNRVLQVRFDRTHGSNGPYNTFVRNQTVIDLDLHESCFENCNILFYKFDQFTQNVIGCVDISSSSKDDLDEVGATRIYTSDVFVADDDPDDMDNRVKSYYHWLIKPSFLPATAWPYVPPYSYNAAEERKRDNWGVVNASTVYSEGWGKYPCVPHELVMDQKFNVSGSELIVYPPSGFYNAYFTVRAKDCTIKSDREIVFTAGDMISLEPGFSTEPGAKFAIEVKEDPCSYAYANREATNEVLVLPKPLIVAHDLSNETYLPMEKETDAAEQQELQKPSAKEISFAVSPNPVEQEMVFRFTLEEPTKTIIVVYNNLMQIVYRSEQSHLAGPHEYSQTMDNLTAGVYTVSFKAGNYIKNQQVVKIDP